MAMDTVSDEHLLRIARQLALGQLTPGMLHELNNPLFAILGLLEFVLPELDEGTKARERVELIQRSAGEVKDIVKTLLDFARRHEDERGVISVAAVAEDTARLFRRTSVARDLELSVVATGRVDVDASPALLGQLFLALYANAHESMARGGTVRVGVAREDGLVIASVSDEGEGVPAPVRARIFEPFFTTRAEHGAAGLGLAIARAIARAEGGELELGQSSGSGSTFVLRLPGA